VGAVPVIVAAAELPLVTVPIDRVFAGPAGPVAPVAPGEFAVEMETPIVSPVVALIVGPVWPFTVTVTLTGSSP
jgi:hypothetical protein